jgi:tetratricopeptide (TPR) repeat protein
MKIIAFTIAFLFGALILINSCKENNLEVSNPNDLSPDTYFKTEAQVQAAINAAYGNMQTTGLYNRVMWFGNDNMAHENIGGSGLEADKRQYLNFSYDPSHAAIPAYWASCYNGIKKANLIITNEDKINKIPDGVMSPARKAKFVGEAKFLRAFYHWLLVVRFGGVPISLGDPTVTALPRSSVAEVYAQIEADLNDAAAKCLPKDQEQKGRVTKGAAYALLGKVLLYQKKYQAALDAFNKVTGYELDPVFFNNFKEETEHNIESIFEVEFNKDAGYSNQWGGDRADAGLNEATFRGQEYGFDWDNAIVSKNCFNEFETIAKGSSKDDPRIEYSFLIPKTITKAGTGATLTNRIVYNGNKDTIEYLPQAQSDGTQYPRVKWRKYSVYYKQKAVENNCTGVNFRPIRYADVILMMAECQANLGNLTAAVALMNQIRARADVDMPRYGTAEMNVKYPVGTLTQFMDALEHERKVELCGEFHRWNDLIRWGKATSFITALKASGTLPVKEQNEMQYSENKLLWPIPQEEINNNPKITNADQNPGY